MIKVLLALFVAFSLHADYWDSYEQFAETMKYQRDYKTALAKAKAEKKDLFIIFVRDGCPFCHKLIDTILIKKNIREYINKHYVKLLIDNYKDKGGSSYPKKFYRPFGPVTYIIDAQSEQIINELDGWMSEDNYLWHL